MYSYFTNTVHNVSLKKSHKTTYSNYVHSVDLHCSKSINGKRNWQIYKIRAEIDLY